MKAYLDLNIFDKIEKRINLELTERSFYELLFHYISTKKIITAYSNAHLNDLFRGFQKNPNFIQGHLKNIQVLTSNLCICQYWGSQKVAWHYRDIFEFFNEKCNEWEYDSVSYYDLFKDQPLMKSVLDLYKFIPLPPEFKQGYKEPMFGIMFPLSKIQGTYDSLHEDIFNFYSRLKSDFSLYRSLKSYLFTSLNRLRNNKEFIKIIRTKYSDLPKHLELHDILDTYTPSTKTSQNEDYSKIIETFFKFDLKGYKTDGHFNNMFDDSLHTFYGAHFDFFITNDERCKYKAEKTYEKLKIGTQVIKINEIEKITKCL